MAIRFSFLVLLIAVSFVVRAQIIEPAKLVAETPTKNVSVGDEVELIFKASIDKGWYIYSVGFDAECGPIPMSVSLEKNASYSLVGDLIAVQDQAKHDKIFDCDVRIFINAGEFRQKIKVLSTSLKLEGSYEGQVCSELEGKCVLFSGDLTFNKIMVSGGKTDKKEPIPKEQTEV